MSQYWNQKTVDAARARHEQDDMSRELARALKIDAHRIRAALQRAGLSLKREDA